MAKQNNQNGNHSLHFKLVYFPQTVGILRTVGAPLMAHGMPKGLLGCYQTANALQFMTIPGYENLILFGTNGPFCSMCWDPHTEEVIEIIAHKRKRNGNIPDMQIQQNIVDQYFIKDIFVNASLEQFRSFVRIVYARFPFDNGAKGNAAEDITALNADWGRAASDLESAFASIEPAILQNVDGFWFNFLSDVRNGDYFTENIIEGQ